MSGDRYTVAGGRILGLGDGPGAVTISGPTITEVTAGPPVDTASHLDADGLIVSPGLIDLQINGGFGLDLATDPAAMWQLGPRLFQHGVTAFLPTIISSPQATTDAALDAIAARPDGYVGAEPLGLHFEGPMLNPERSGAHPPANLATPAATDIGRWSARAGVRLVTIAPELPGATAAVAELAARGVVVSAGHSTATAEEARVGVEAGVSMVTHLFNAMAPMGHRRPNLAGLALATPGIVAGLIVDGVHVDPLVVAAAWRAKGPAGIVLVTDAVAPMGVEAGRFELAGRAVTADLDRVVDAEGRLAGSLLTQDRAVRNLVAFTGCRPEDALAAATSTPAAAIGAVDRGRIQPGARADLALFDDALEVQLTICGGRVVHATESALDRLPAGLEVG